MNAHEQELLQGENEDLKRRVAFWCTELLDVLEILRKGHPLAWPPGSVPRNENLT